MLGCLAALPSRVAVAYSGGPDSSALLHATLRVVARRGGEVVALHVHHGLSRHADAWVEHGRRQCERWSATIAPVRFIVDRVAADRRADETLEVWARRARYRALAGLAHARGIGTVLLAHHRRDQAETLLLQALRGGGVAGLAAMPDAARRDGIVWWRPWLDQPRHAIDDYLGRHRLETVLDESNQDRRHARSRLRLEVWPALVGAFAHAEPALANSARWAQEARDVLKEVAVADLACVAPRGDLLMAAWLTLSPGRRSNVLRAWLRQTTSAVPAAALVTELMRVLPMRTTGSWPLRTTGCLRLFGGVLAFERTRVVPTQPHTIRLRIDGPGCHVVPGWAGALRVEPADADMPGWPLSELHDIELRARVGGERFSLGPGRPARSLKKQFQERGVPAWDRDGPLVYANGCLVFVPGLGMDGRLGAPASGEPRMRLVWDAGSRPRGPPGQDGPES